MPTTTAEPGDRRQPRPAEAGMTILELMISGMLLVGIVALTFSSTWAIQSLTRHGELRNREAGGARAVLAVLREDLVGSSLREDPFTGEVRCRIEAAAHGNDRIRYQRVVGATMEGGGLQAVWSPWTTVEIDADGTVTRTEEGSAARVLGRGIDSLDYAVLSGRVIEIRCVTGWTDTRTGARRTTTVVETVTPTH